MTAHSSTVGSLSNHGVEQAEHEWPLPSEVTDSRARSGRQKKQAASPTPKRHRPEKPILVEALARRVGVEEGQVIVRIAKAYLGYWQPSGADCRVKGEIHNIPWAKYEPLVSGVQWISERVLKLTGGSLKSQCELWASAANLRASFVIELPRPMTTTEQLGFDIAVSGYNQRLKDQEKKLVLDLLQDQDKDMVEIGVEAAEHVRRLAPRSTLPAPVELVGGASDKASALEQRIGRYPDPEKDLEDQTLEGLVDAVDKGKGQIMVLGHAKQEAQSNADGNRLTGKAPSKRKPVKPKRIAVKFDKNKFDPKVLSDLMNTGAAVEFQVAVKMRSGKDFLSLTKIVEAGDT